MATMIGSARIDENGHASGGKAGDQTGRELSTQAWYNHSKGWRVFRPKSAKHAEKIAVAMESACKNSHIGYDQAQRNTLYALAEAFGFDPAKVNKNTETDCSALVRVCCAYAGIKLPNFTTVNEASTLTNSGAFVELTASKYTGSGTSLRRGDILVTREKGHTAVVISNGSKASSDKAWTYIDDVAESTNEAVSEPHTEPLKESKTVTVAKGAWNIRKAGSTKAVAFTTVKGGQVLHCTEIVNGWCHVWGNDRNGKRFEDGWISEKGIV